MPTGAALQYHIRNRTTPGADYNVQPVTAAGIDGAGIVVAVIDDGVQTDHPAFAGRLDLARSYDFVSGIASPSGNFVPGAEESDEDVSDTHGTAVAGVALGNATWGGPIGVAPGATLAAIRINIGGKPVPGSPNAANPSKSDLGALGMDQATKVADVSNNSWGGEGVADQTYAEPDNAALGTALQRAVTTGRGGKGLIVVFAAGNDGDSGDDVSFQATTSDPRVIAVGGLNADGTPALGLTHGAGLLVSGAAVGVVTANRYAPDGAVDSNGLPTGSYKPITGTSFAAPGVSGVVALMLQANPDLGWRDVQEILVDSAKIPGANAITKPDGTPWFTTLGTGDWNGGGRHFSNAYGYGLPDADVAVQFAKTWVPRGTSLNLVTATTAGRGGIAVTGGAEPVSTSLTVGSSLRIQHVQLTIAAPSLTIPNVRLVLTAPDGTRSVIADQAGTRQDVATQPGGPADAVQYFNKDGSPKLDDDGKPTFNTGKLDHTLNDAAFWGVDAKGAWTLEITDFRTGETGTVDSWSLTLWGDAADAPRTLVYTPEFATVAAADPARATIRTAGATGTIDAAAMAGETRLDLNGGAGLLGGVAVTVQGGTGNAIGGRGATTLIGTAGANRLAAGDGDTLIVGGGGADTVLGGAGRDTLLAGGGGAIVVSGARGALVVLGNDDILLGGGADTVIGGAGIQTAFALAGKTEAFAGSGTLEFINAGAASTVVGGGGRVIAFGGAQGDVLSGGTAGGNVLVSGTGAATLFGGGDGDVLFAQGGATQVLRAGAGNETLSGAGSSTGAVYFAGSGTVVIGAGAGNDTVFGGGGNATVLGGAGADLFAFKRGEAGGRMLIGGFDANKGDRITLQGYEANAVQTALSGAAMTQAGYTLTLSDNTRVSFSTLDRLSATAFV